MRLKLLVAITTALGIGAASRVATWPPFDPVADASKIARIGPSGYPNYAAATINSNNSLTITASGGNARAITANGNGTGDGIQATGGGTNGNGLFVTGGVSNG